MKLRRGDTVFFGRGGNKYLGEVKRVFKATAAIEVETIHGHRWTVKTRDVLQVTSHNLTVSEQAALVALKGHAGATVKVLAARGYRVSGGTLARLAERGLVTGWTAGATGGSVFWQLTPDGRAELRRIRAS